MQWDEQKKACAAVAQMYGHGGYFQKMSGKLPKMGTKLEKIPVVNQKRLLYNIKVV